MTATEAESSICARDCICGRASEETEAEAEAEAAVSPSGGALNTAVGMANSPKARPLWRYFLGSRETKSELGSTA